MIQREIPGDAEDPGAAPRLGRIRNRTPRDAQEHFLGELPNIAVPDNPAQVTEDTVAVRRKQDVSVSHHQHVLTL